MYLAQLVLRNVRRSPLRAGMTVMTVAIMLSAFIFPRSLVEAQAEQIRQTPNNRVVTRAKSGWGGSFPASYADVLRELPGVKHVCGAMGAGFRIPGKDNLFFGTLAIQAEPFVAMHYELEWPEEQKRAFLADDRSAVVSVALANELGWKLGDRLVFESRQYPGTWEVTVAGIAKSTREGFGRRNVWIHWKYLNRTLPLDKQDTLGFISAEIHEPNEGGRIATDIDARFASSTVQTLSLEDQVLTATNIGQFSAILTALDVVSYLILAIVMSIVGNTLAMNVRERTREYGVLRAIGFGPGHLAFLVLGEGALLGLAGGVVGLAISYPLIEGVVSRALQDALNFPPVEIPMPVAGLSLALGAGLSLLAATLPVYRLGRVSVTEAIRRVG